MVEFVVGLAMGIDPSYYSVNQPVSAQCNADVRQNSPTVVGPATARVRASPSPVVAVDLQTGLLQSDCPMGPTGEYSGERRAGVWVLTDSCWTGDRSRSSCSLSRRRCWPADRLAAV